MTARDRQAVLVVDDDEGVRDYLAEVVRRQGYECQSFESALSLLSHMATSDFQANLVLSDIGMPGVSGMDLLRTLKALSPELPVILVSGMYELTLAMEALKAGASDYLLKPARPEDVARLLNKHLSDPETQRREEMKSAVSRLIKERRGQGQHRSGALVAIFDALGFKRYETLQHSQRVAAYAALFGRAIGMRDEAIAPLELGALLHDIGKIGIPHNVLMKPLPLSDEEWRVMRLHPSIGAQLLSELPGLEVESNMVLCHHERFDGKGYPQGLSGEAIPLEARLFSIVDAYDAMTSDRPYRRSMTGEVARAEIQKTAGHQFDSTLAKIFLDLPVEALQEIRKRFPDEPVDPSEGWTE